MADYKALVIDYEPRGIKQLREPLESAGFEVHVAQDGDAGRKAFDLLKPDVAVIEAMLPKRHGFDLCADLKKTPHGAKTPIVIVTSVYRGRKYRNQAIHQYGCDEFMEKPVDAERLLTTVRQLVERARTAAGLPLEPVRPAPAVAAPAVTAPAAAAPAAAPAPAAAKKPAPAQVAAHDDPEDEISRRLDELLGGGDGGGDSSGTPRASINPAHATSRNLLPFDRDRGRRSQDRPAPVGVTEVAPRVSTSVRVGMAGGGAPHAHAHAHAVVPREARPSHALDLELGQGQPQRPSPKPRPGVPPPSSRRLRWLVILLVLTLGLAILSAII